MIAAPKQPLVEVVARAIHRKRQDFGFGGQAQWKYEPEQVKSLHLATAQAAIDACHVAEMRELLHGIANYPDANTISDAHYVIRKQARALFVKLDGKP